MRSLLKEWLSVAGHRVSAAEPAEAAAPAESAAPSAADLVIVSIYMPKSGGAQLVRKIRGAHPGVPVIALSGQFRSGLSTDGATAQALGVQQVFAKPLARKDLLEAIRAIICTPSRSGG